MRGHYEESEEVKADRALQDAARAYAARFLQFLPSNGYEVALRNAAIRYAATQPRPRKKTSTKRSTPNE